MRYGIFSDLHANLQATEALIDACKKEALDTWVCVGDIVGYGANPKECIARVEALAAISVAGNHDWASVELYPTERFNPLASQAISWTSLQLDKEERDFLTRLEPVYKNADLTAVHGTLDAPEDFDYMLGDSVIRENLALLDTGICFVGHTHLPQIIMQDADGHIRIHPEAGVRLKEDSKYIVNVGSVGQPRDRDARACYCVYDTAKREVQIKRLDYDAQSARDSIIAAGLPVFLGDRLLRGI